MTDAEQADQTADDRPGFDPFHAGRAGSGILNGVVGEDNFLMVLRYDELKRVCRDWRTFSNDAPFRVPIPSEHDVRAVRQLPIETNPPDHTDYRDIVEGPFSRATAASIEPSVRQVTCSLLDDALRSGSFEVVRSFALPVQSRSLALMLGRSQDEATQWISWGTHVFRDTAGGHASDLDQYLQQAIEDAVAAPGDDFFGLLAKAVFRGRSLTAEEMMGFANLTFAGGRDTVINAITNSLHFLADHPDSLAAIRSDPGIVKATVEEFLRYFSPLTHIGRVVAGEAEVGGCRVAEDSIVSLCYASANRDETIFERADECVLDRRPNRHVAFGHGPHTCLGAPLARMVLAVVLECFAAKVASASVVEVEEKLEDLGAVRRLVGFERVVLRVSAVT